MKKMVLLLSVFLIGIMFLGCTKKYESNLQPYVSPNSNENNDAKIKIHFIGTYEIKLKSNSSTSKKLNFLGVEDQRATKVVSTILDEGKVVEEFGLSNNLKIWYREAFLREFQNTNISQYNGKFVDILVNIKQLEATYNKDKLDKKNMQAHIVLELVLKEAKKTITSNITISQTSYNLIVSDAGDFEKILNESMRESVSKTVSILMKKLNDL